eukprot:jgi/Undpi1/266/HiC_scaffold_1.g00262.m1
MMEPGSSSSTTTITTTTTREHFLQVGSTAVAAALFGATVVLDPVGFPAGAAFGKRIAGVESAGAVESAVPVGDSQAVLETQILSYIREALPSWRPLPDSDIELKQITGGITNVIFKARNAGTGEGALVRVYGKDTDLLLDRRKEAAVFSELSTLGFGPRKLGEFKGGRVEELLDARAATPAELLQTRPFDVPRAIAAQLASLHGQRVQSSAGSASRPVMWTTIDRWLETATRLDAAQAFLLEKVAEEVKWLKQRLPEEVEGGTSSPSPAQKRAAEIADGIVFAHNDLLSGNVLVGPRGAKQISTLRLIDFEYSDYNPCGYDIANHFCECAGFDADFRRKYPSVAQRKSFLGAYIEAADALRAKPDTPPSNNPSTDDLLRELVARVDKYTLASHLTWGLWAIIQANTSEIEGFDFAEYAKKRLDGYTFHKGQFFA